MVKIYCGLRWSGISHWSMGEIMNFLSKLFDKRSRAVETEVKMGNRIIYFLI